MIHEHHHHDVHLCPSSHMTRSGPGETKAVCTSVKYGKYYTYRDYDNFYDDDNFYDKDIKCDDVADDNTCLCHFLISCLPVFFLHHMYYRI